MDKLNKNNFNICSSDLCGYPIQKTFPNMILESKVETFVSGNDMSTGFQKVDYKTKEVITNQYKDVRSCPKLKSDMIEQFNSIAKNKKNYEMVNPYFILFFIKQYFETVNDDNIRNGEFPINYDYNEFTNKNNICATNLPIKNIKNTANVNLYYFDYMGTKFDTVDISLEINSIPLTNTEDIVEKDYLWSHIFPKIGISQSYKTILDLQKPIEKQLKEEDKTWINTIIFDNIDFGNNVKDIPNTDSINQDLTSSSLNIHVLICEDLYEKYLPIIINKPTLLICNNCDKTTISVKYKSLKC